MTTLDSFPLPKQSFTWEPNTMTQGDDGNLYGTTAEGGKSGGGVIFKTTPQGNPALLHQFCDPSCKNGYSPTSGLVQGSDGNLYGTTSAGGLLAYAGSVYEMTPTGIFSTLYLFCHEKCLDGEQAGALMQATDGSFYGTTVEGGTGGEGTVFRLSTGLIPFVVARPSLGSVGQIVTILGNNLTGATGVTFNGTAAVFEVMSDGFIQARVPTGATTGPIRVTTPSITLKGNVAFHELR